MIADGPGAATHGWTSAERETFFDAIARHRRAGWRVVLVSVLADLVVALVIAVLMAPLFYAGIALIFDVANLVHRAPNLVAVSSPILAPLVDHPESVPVSRWAVAGVVAAAPGLIWMISVVLVLERAVGLSSVFGGGDLRGRALDEAVLAEERFGNVISEMALAANVPPPRVLVVESTALNAAVSGRDERHASIVVSSELLSQLDRDEMQGVAAHLIGSIANGDMTIGMRVATTLGLFALIAGLAGAFTEGSALRRLLRKLLVATVLPTPQTSRDLLAELADPMAPTPERSAGNTGARGWRTRPDQPSSDGGWRTLVWMPLAGPIAMAGFFGAVISLFGLQPLVSLAWRQRKYMADATAVQLTRDPDTLSRALEKMSSGGDGLFGAWAAHLCVVQPGARGSGLMGAPVVPGYPSLARRLRALAKLGAHVAPTDRRVPWRLVLIVAPLVAVVAALIGVVLYLLAIVSVALSMLFLGIPFGVLHVVLRWLGG